MNEIKSIFKSILPYLIILFLLVVLLKDCGNSEPPPQTINKDSLYTIIAEKTQINDYLKNENKSIKLITDSLKGLKPKVIVRYKTIYDSLLVVDTMCVQALNTLHDEHTKIDSVNNHIISNQSKVIKNDSNIITNYKQISSNYKIIHTKDSIRNKQLTDTIPTVKRKGYIKGFIHGFGSGAAVTKGVEVITNLR